MKRNAGLLILMSLLLFPGAGLLAQAREGRQLVTAGLISDAAHTAKPFVVGIRFTIQPEWYLYWKNPGDAGLPIEVRWELPKGWKAGELQFPVPSKFVHEGITAFGYKNELILLATIRPAAGSEGSLKARLDWLVCRESCLRGGATVTLNPSMMSPEQRGEASSLLAASRSRLPGTQKDSGIDVQARSLSHEDDQWTLKATLTGEKATAVRDFYPEVVDGLVMDLQRITIQNRELSIGFVRQSESVNSANIRGLLVTDSSAFEIEIPIQFSTQ